MHKKLYIDCDFVCTHPMFTDKTWVWKTTKTGNKSRIGNGWDIVNAIAKKNGLTIREFCDEYHVGVYGNHIEI